MDKIFQDITQAIENELYSIFENPFLVIMQVIATILLFVIIRIFLWKPITKYLEEKQEATNRELMEAHEKNIRADKLKKEVVAAYEAAKEETQNFKKTLQEEALLEKERIIREAREEAKRRLDQVELDVRQEVKKANEKIRQSIKEISIAAAEKIVQHEIDADEHEAMINALIDDKF